MNEIGIFEVFKKMAYKKRKVESRKLKNMREARLRKIQEGNAPEYPLPSK